MSPACASAARKLRTLFGASASVRPPDRTLERQPLAGEVLAGDPGGTGVPQREFGGSSRSPAER